MALYHVKTQTVADGTATSLVRPSDWNSGHAQYFTFAGNTAGQSTASGTNIYFAGGNGITLNMAQGAGVATISIVAGNYLTTAMLSNAGSNFLPVSTVTAGANAYNVSGTFASNGITLSGQPNNVSLLGNTVGANTVAPSAGGTIYLSGGNGITLSGNGSTVVISAGAVGFTKTFWHPYNEAVNVAGIHGQATLVVNPIPLNDYLSMNRLVFPLYFSNASNSTGTLSISLYWGAYTKNGSTLSSVATLSTLITMAYAGNNSSSNQRGIRLLTVPFTTQLNQNRYFVAVGIRTSTSSHGCSFSQILVSQLNSSVSGLWNQAATASIQWPIGVGYFSASTTALPATIAFSNLRGNSSLAARPPSWHAISGTV